ncbi:MAG: NAD(P)H-binding protein [Stackebrandtia sp.]
MTSQATNRQTILTIGGTGKVGRRLVPRLRLAGRRVRVASRSGQPRFDWHDRSTWTPALSGVDTVYLAAAGDPDPVDDFVKQAVAAGVRRLVAQSGRQIEQFGEGSDVFAVQHAVRNSGVEWTVLQPNNFNQNFDTPGEDMFLKPLLDGELALPIGETGEPFVDTEDIAEVAAAVLTEDGHAGHVYELSGPRDLSFGEAVEMISTASGRPMAYRDVPPEDFSAGLRSAGAPEALITFLDAMFAFMRAGKTSSPADGVQQVLGREPIAFETYVARAAATGVWS